MEGVIKEYFNDLSRGGFSRMWIKKVLDAATKGYSRMLTNQFQGTGKINRPEASSRKAYALRDS